MIGAKETIVLRFKTNSKAHLHIVKRAAQMLNEALSNIKPKVVFCVPEKGCDYEIEFISKQKMATIARGALGFYDKINHKIYILFETTSPRTETETISTLMHEMLHALGTPHFNGEHSLMHENDTGVRGVTEYEVRAVIQLLNQKFKDNLTTGRWKKHVEK